MQKRIPASNLSYYVSPQTMEAVHRGAGVRMSRAQAPAQSSHGSMDNREEEEVADEVEDP